jgi:hypothetical protein
MTWGNFLLPVGRGAGIRNAFVLLSPPARSTGWVSGKRHLFLLFICFLSFMVLQLIGVPGNDKDWSSGLCARTRLANKWYYGPVTTAYAKAQAWLNSHGSRTAFLHVSAARHSPSQLAMQRYY